jgi:hypothetical protein
LITWPRGREKERGAHRVSPKTATEWHALFVLMLASWVQKPSLGSYLSTDLWVLKSFIQFAGSISIITKKKYRECRDHNCKYESLWKS